MMGMPMDITDDLKARLKKAESNQRSRAKRLNKKIEQRNERLPKHQQSSLIEIEKVDILALFEWQAWSCQCHRVPGRDGCFQHVDVTKPARHPDAPVIGHINNMDNLGGHVASNIGVMRHVCNMEICCTIEKKRAAKTARQQAKHSGVCKNGANHKPRLKKRIPTHQGGWPKGRKLQSRKFSKKRNPTEHRRAG